MPNTLRDTLNELRLDARVNKLAPPPPPAPPPEPDPNAPPPPWRDWDAQKQIEYGLLNGGES